MCVQVQQSFAVTSLGQQMPALLTLLQQHMQQEPDYKVLPAIALYLSVLPTCVLCNWCHAKQILAGAELHELCCSKT